MVLRGTIYDVTYEFARETFEYDGDSGDLRWRVRPRHHFRTARGHAIFNAQRAGKSAAVSHPKCGAVVCVGGKSYPARKVVWLLHSGVYPEFVRAVDGDLANLRLGNLTTKHWHFDRFRDIPRGYLSASVEYVDGDLVWKARPDDHFQTARAARRWNEKFPGKSAGRRTGKYFDVELGGARVRVHQIVWFLHRGYWADYLDHANGNPHDNRIENLRACTRSENAANSGMRPTNTSGFRGVRKVGNRWTAQISRLGKSVYLGSFVSAEEASEAYQAAYRKQHREFARLT